MQGITLESTHMPSGPVLLQLLQKPCAATFPRPACRPRQSGDAGRAQRDALCMCAVMDESSLHKACNDAAATVRQRHPLFVVQHSVRCTALPTSVAVLSTGVTIRNSCREGRREER